MSSILTLALGILVTFMVYFNSKLSQNTGYSTALFFIHFSGLMAVTLLRLVKKTGWKICFKNPFLLSAGFLGVFAVLFQNISFNNIGAALTFSATLAGQITASFFIDTFGLMGSEKYNLTLRRMLPPAVILCGLFLLAWR